MRPLLSIFLYFAFFLNITILSLAKVVHVQSMSRQCERAPKNPNVLPKDPIDWMKEANLEFGQLTPLGLNHCFLLGNFIRERYLTSTSDYFIKNIDPQFQSLDYKFQASAVHRTIMGTWAQSLGMFPWNGPKSDIDSKASLPDQVQPIPVHSVSQANDVILRSFDKCPAVNINHQNKDLSAEAAKYDATIKKAVELTGFPTTYREFFDLYDLIISQRSAGLLKKITIDEATMAEFHTAASSSMYQFFARDVMGNLGGGKFVENLINEMELFVQNKTSSKSKEPKGFKYVHFSGHDSTLFSILTALRILDDYAETRTILPWCSTIFFELHEYDNAPKTYFVRLMLKQGYDGPLTQLRFKTLGGSGCEEDCPYQKFKQLVQSDAIPTDWCSACRNEITDICMQESLNLKSIISLVLIVIIALLIAFSVILILCIVVLFMRRPSAALQNQANMYNYKSFA